MSALVLPRARRRRRKPPPPSFWRALFWLIWDAAFGILDTFLLMQADSAFWIVWFGCFAVLVFRSLAYKTWPRFRAELRAWLEDE